MKQNISKVDNQIESGNLHIYGKGFCMLFSWSPILIPTFPPTKLNKLYTNVMSQSVISRKNVLKASLKSIQHKD